MTGSTVSPAPLNISLDDIKPGADAVLVACFSGSNAPPPEECTSRSSYCAADISAALSMSYPSPDAQQPHSPSYGLEEIETPNNASSSTAPWVGATVVATTPLAKAASVRKQAWKTHEDARLLELVELHGASNWSRIAAELPSRIGKQCRERWHNHLSPSVKKESFSEDEDRAIMEAVAAHGTKWAHIVKLIPGRTDNAIKNRWNSTTRRMLRIQRRCGGSVPGLGDVDLAQMDAQAIAKQMIAQGVSASDAQQPKPLAKRKLSTSTKGDKGASAAAAAGEGAEAADGATGEGADGATSADKSTAKVARRAVGKGPRGSKKTDGLALLRAATMRSAEDQSGEGGEGGADGGSPDTQRARSRGSSGPPSSPSSPEG
ncbi:myb family transcription factor, partial [Chrysochromulina tobinii]